MRFWPTDRKFQLALGVVYLVLTPLQFFGWFPHDHNWLNVISPFNFVLLTVMFLSNYSCPYWELQPNFLYERRVLRQRHVAYADILTVQPHWAFWSSSYFKIEYDAHRPSGKPKRLYVNPADPNTFFATLRERAPQTAFNIPAPPPPAPANIAL